MIPVNEIIKESVGVSEVLKTLGYPVVNRHSICPFHNDSNPSLSISKTDLEWYCFVCGFGGDVINLIMRHSNSSFNDALAWFNITFKLGLTTKGNIDYAKIEDRKNILKSKMIQINELRNKWEVAAAKHRYLIHEAKRPSLINPGLGVQPDNVDWGDWTAGDYCFESMFHQILDDIEDKIRLLEER